MFGDVDQAYREPGGVPGVIDQPYLYSVHVSCSVEKPDLNSRRGGGNVRSPNLEPGKAFASDVEYPADLYPFVPTSGNIEYPSDLNAGMILARDVEDS
ncbi:hypothetical protein ES703_79196 [subsurface metagenome]